MAVNSRAGACGKQNPAYSHRNKRGRLPKGAAPVHLGNQQIERFFPRRGGHIATAVCFPCLAALLATVPPGEVYGVCLAFEGMRRDEPFSMPWLDRNSFPNPAREDYDDHDPK